MTSKIFEFENIEEFTSTAFQKEPFVFRSVLGTELVSWEDINLLLEKDILDFPRVRLANESNSAVRGYRGFVNYTLSVTGEATPHVNRYSLLKSLQSGSTLIIDRCQAYFEKVMAATTYLNEQLQCRAGANLYCAWSSMPGFGMHFDNHDVIAVQIEGSKTWDIYPPTLAYPLPTDKSFDFEPPTGVPLMSITVAPGQAIYLPAGYWHNVRTESERSLHISFTVMRPRKIDVIRKIIDSLGAYPEMREPIALQSNAVANSTLHGIIHSCLASVNIDEWETAIIEDCKKGRFVKFNLPSIRTKDVSN